jgi:hypothetical protein
MDWPGFESGLPRWESDTNCLDHDTFLSVRVKTGEIQFCFKNYVSARFPQVHHTWQFKYLLVGYPSNKKDTAWHFRSTHFRLCITFTCMHSWYVYWVRTSAREWNFSILQNVQTDFRAHRDSSYSMSTGGSLPEVKQPKPQVDHHSRPRTAEARKRVQLHAFVEWGGRT